MNPYLVCLVTTCAIITAFNPLDVKTTKRRSMGYEQEVTLSHACEQMNQNGDFTESLANLKTVTQRLSAIKMNPASLPEIKSVQEDIHKIVQTITGILKVDSTEDKWTSTFDWEIKPQDILDIPTELLQKGFRFTELKLKNINLAGISRPDLIPLAKVIRHGNSLKVSLTKPTNTLELCQLQGTFLIEITYVYQFFEYSVPGHTYLAIETGTESETAITP